VSEPGRPTPHRRRAGPIRLAGALATLLVAAIPVEAGAESGSPYNGASHGPEIFVGLGDASVSDEREVSTAIGFRHSFVFLLGDARLSYIFEGDADGPGPIDRHGLWLHGAVHPLAPGLLGSDWLAYVLSSPYLEIGAGGLVYSGAFPADVNSPAFAWSVGAGIDIPLLNPDRGQAPWLHLLYRFRTDASNAGAAARRSKVHALYLGLSWRFNGTVF